MTLEKIVEERLAILKRREEGLREELNGVEANVTLLVSLLSENSNGKHWLVDGTLKEGARLLKPGEAVLEFVRLFPGKDRAAIVNSLAQHRLDTSSGNVKALLSTTVQKAIKDKKIIKKGSGFVLAK